MRKHMVTVGIASVALSGGLLTAPAANAQQVAATTTAQGVATATAQAPTIRVADKDKDKFKKKCKIVIKKVYKNGKWKVVVKIRCVWVRR